MSVDYEIRQRMFRCSSLVSMPECSGIYYLLDHTEIVYIGQSINVASRIIQHKREGVKVFNRYYCMPCEVERLNYWESFLILEYSPKYNKTLPKNDIFYDLYSASEICEVPIETIEYLGREKMMNVYNFNGKVLYDIEQISEAMEEIK